MLIAATADGALLTSAVSESFEDCEKLLIINIDDEKTDYSILDDLTAEAFENTGAKSLAELIIERDCEAVITGSFLPDTFNILADALVTRYDGSGHTVAEALRLMDDNTLPYIRYATPDEDCESAHLHGSGECDCDAEH